MKTSEARMIANKLNAARSSGPKTPEGKAKSRANGLKHGMTGRGVVLGVEDAGEVRVRNEDLQTQLNPQTALGAILILQMATHSVRMERGARQEAAAIDVHVRHATEDFDEARLAEVKWLMDTLADDPRENVRKLRKSPEGVERLIDEWNDLRDDLTDEVRPTWSEPRGHRASNLTGSRADAAGTSPIMTLTRATWGQFGGLAPAEGADLDLEARKGWARGRLVEWIDAEIAALEAHFETLDFETIELDRAKAPDIALFNPSKEAALARRYEAEARRGFFRSLKELRKVEAEFAEGASPPEEAPVAEPLGSCRENREATPRDPRPTPPDPLPVDDRAAGGPVNRLKTVGQPEFCPA